MFTVRIESGFTASHQLIMPDGSKEPLHCHNWQVAVDVSSEKLNSMGLVMDFIQLKSITEAAIAPFEGSLLNEIDYFAQNNSSAENVTKYIYDNIEDKLPKGVKLEAVSVVEAKGCSAKFAK